MTNLQCLFVEFNVSNIEDLITEVSNLIDWYAELLIDDCWNTWAVVSKAHYEDLLHKLMFGSDTDIDIS